MANIGEEDPKRALRKLRNRRSAQESRERKRKFVEDIAEVNQRLADENQALREKLRKIEDDQSRLLEKFSEISKQLERANIVPMSPPLQKTPEEHAYMGTAVHVEPSSQFNLFDIYEDHRELNADPSPIYDYLSDQLTDEGPNNTATGTTPPRSIGHEDVRDNPSVDVDARTNIEHSSDESTVLVNRAKGTASLAVKARTRMQLPLKHDSFARLENSHPSDLKHGAVSAFLVVLSYPTSHIDPLQSDRFIVPLRRRRTSISWHPSFTPVHLTSKSSQFLGRIPSCRPHPSLGLSPHLTLPGLLFSLKTLRAIYMRALYTSLLSFSIIYRHLFHMHQEQTSINK